MIRARRLAVAVLVGLIARADAAAFAQGGGMPDLKQMMGKPLPVPDLPPGTVTVRVSRKLPMNGAAGVTVKATITAVEGHADKASSKEVVTDGEGRATFSGLTPQSRFLAHASVDGEELESSEFVVPETGGTRVLLISGLGGAATEGSATDAFSTMAMNGVVEPDPNLPAGTLEVKLLGEGDQPRAGREVVLGIVGKDRALTAKRGRTDASGIARFTDLATGDAAGYATVADYDGQKLGTPAFRLPPDHGVRATVRPLGVTTDTSVLRLDDRSRFAFEPREDALVVYEMLSVRNPTDKIVDPGLGGILFPLPKGFQGAQPLDSSAPVEVRAREGMVYRGKLMPSGPDGQGGGAEVRFAFIAPALGERTVQLRQPMPYGMRRPLLIVPASAQLQPIAEGLRTLPPETDKQGNKVNLYEIPDVAPGGTLELGISGISVPDHGGRNVAAVLITLLIVGGILLSAGGSKAAVDSGQRDELLARREALFAELVALERASSSPDARQRTSERRRELVTKLERVYRDLAAAERGDSDGAAAAPPRSSSGGTTAPAPQAARS